MNIFNTKKAGVGMLAGIIFILACAALMTAFLIRTQIQAKEKLDIEACAINVAWNDKTKQMINLNNCYTYDLEEIKEETKKAAINNIIDRVRDCWHEFGAGQKDPWGGNWLEGQDARCFVCFKFHLADPVFSITHDEFLAELNKRPKEQRDFLLSASITASDDNPYFFIHEMDFKEGSIFSLGIADLTAFTYFDQLSAYKNYGVIFWYVASKRGRQIFMSDKGGGYAIITPLDGARQRLDCSQYYYIPAK
jgi:hypothetical protein